MRIDTETMTGTPGCTANGVVDDTSCDVDDSGEDVSGGWRCVSDASDVPAQKIRASIPTTAARASCHVNIDRVQPLSSSSTLTISAVVCR